MNDFQLFLLQVEVTRASEEAAEQYPGRLVTHDISEGVWNELTGEERKTLLSLVPDERYRVLRWRAAKVAAREITDLEHHSGVVSYSIHEVSRHLNQGILTKAKANLSGESLDVFLDLQRAVRNLSWKHYRTLWLRAMGFEAPGMANAVRALAEKLNGKRIA